VYQREQNELEVTRTRELADIETEKFKNMVDAIGANTLQAIATAGPDMQVSTKFRSACMLRCCYCFFFV